MKVKISRGERAFDIFNICFMALIIVVMAYPLLYVLFASFSDSSALLSHRGLLFAPLKFTPAAYQKVFRNPLILSGYGNTLIILVIGVVTNIFMTALGAYFLSRKNVLFKQAVMFLIVITMFISGGMIPFYLTVQKFGLLNTRAGLIIPFMISTYNLILMRTSMQGIPVSLEESAKLDGAGHMTILMRIVLPLSKPIIAVMILYYGVGIWNSWFWASALIRDRSLYPLQVILREILINSDTNTMMGGGVSVGDQEAVTESIKYATIVVATLPILCVYPFLQKYFVKGIMVGALKG